MSELTPAMWSATLNPHSSRYQIWHGIFQRDTNIPLHSPLAVKAKLDGDPEEVYLLDWNNMDEESSYRLVRFVMEKFHVDEQIAEGNLNEQGMFPVRREDLIVTMSMRAFM